MSWRAVLRELSDTIPADEVVDAIGELARADAVLRQRLLMNGAGAAPAPVPEPPAEPDRLLDVEELAERLRVTHDYIYRNASQWPFTRKLSPKMLRFSEAGLNRCLSIRQT